MIAALLAGCVLAAATVVPADPEKLLGENADLLRQHRGYVRWMADHPEAAAREEAFLGLMTLSGFHDVTVAFDEALVESPAASRAYDTFYTHLAADPVARDRVERLARVMMAAPEAIPGRQAAMTWLQANPEAARRFLQDPVLLTPTPEALAPLRNVVREYPDWWTLLQDAFREVEDAPETYDRVVPWWQQALRLDTDHTEAHAKLALHLARYPNRFWVWHRRELALATDSQARNWVRYWHRVLRRSDVDLRAYYSATRPLVAAGTAPEETVEPWPPKTDPPALAPYRGEAPGRDTDQSDKPARPKVERPAMRGPDRPSIRYPTRPTAPTRPTRPTVERPTPAE